MESYMGVGELVSVPFFGRNLIGQLMSKEQKHQFRKISQYQWISTRALALVSIFLWGQSYASHCQDYLLWATILNSSTLTCCSLHRVFAIGRSVWGPFRWRKIDGSTRLRVFWVALVRSSVSVWFGFVFFLFLCDSHWKILKKLVESGALDTRKKLGKGTIPPPPLAKEQEIFFDARIAK